MNEYKEYLETGMLGSYRPESAIVKKTDSGAAFAVFRDSTYTLDDDTVMCAFLEMRTLCTTLINEMPS